MTSNKQRTPEATALINRVQNLSQSIIRWRRDLHRIPEVGCYLPKTKAYIDGELRKLGLTAKPSGDGMIVDLPFNSPTEGKITKRIAFRTDMDALPMQELKETEYKSQHEGNMHSCGHDAHMAIALGTAKYFVENKPSFPIRILFQPDEEGDGGAAKMIEDGALNGVDAIFGVHVGDLFGKPPRKIGIRYGAMLAACDTFRIRFTAHGTHAASPQTGGDPVVASAQFINAVQALRTREIHPAHPCIISICSIHGGTATNIVPECVELLGTARTVETSDRELVVRRMREIARAVSDRDYLGAEVRWECGFPMLINHDREVQLVEQAAIEMLGQDEVCRIEYPSLGGEDMAFYLERIPGCFWSFPALNPDKGISAPNHNPHFDVDDSLLWIPVLVNVRTAELNNTNIAED